jgi:hypothetical protein
MLRGLTSFPLFVGDVAAAERWYSDLLGIEPSSPRHLPFEVQRSSLLVTGNAAPILGAIGPSRRRRQRRAQLP